MWDMELADKKRRGKTSGNIKECRVEMVGVRAEKEGDTAGFQHILFSNKI